MRFTSAHAIATTALFVALGGTSYAVSKLPKNSVGSEQVRDASLQAADLAPGVVASGPRGPRGAQGPTGPAGVPGATGRAGDDVTQSRNPAVFRAHNVTPQTNGSSGYAKILFGGEDFDPNGVYDPATSAFTAPVDGFYEFYATVVIAFTESNRLFVQLQSDRPGMQIRGNDMTTSGDQQAHVSGVMRLAKGEHVWVDVLRSKIVEIPGTTDGGPLTSFGGYLISSS